MIFDFITAGSSFYIKAFAIGIVLSILAFAGNFVNNMRLDLINSEKDNAVLTSSLDIEKETFSLYRENSEEEQEDYKRRDDELRRQYREDRKEIDNVKKLIAKTNLTEQARKNKKAVTRFINAKYRKLWRDVEKATSDGSIIISKDKGKTPKT